MKQTKILLTLLIWSVIQINFAQKRQGNAIIIGQVLNKKKAVPFATVSIKGTTKGTTTDENGHYELKNLPAGTYIVVAQSFGYKPQEKKVSIKAGETKVVNFNLKEDVLSLEQVVITGDRTKTNRLKASTIVNTISTKLFKRTQSVTLGEGLNFCPGVRMETDCQNCGFSQVRMNGMEGPYSQILINSRPIFSGLAGVYGLELIPSSMIQRVEVIRGGGSALYGSNAIAGTINIILKEPTSNSYEFGLNTAQTGVGLKGSGKPTPDNSVNFNTSIVSDDYTTGMTVFGFYRDRKPFDANEDGFSEIASLNNTTIGTRLFHRFGMRNKLIADFFNIKEDRRGGDRFEYPPHEANIAESLKHNVTTGALTYEQYLRENDKLSVYASGQKIDRHSYYGANQSLKDYGRTKNFTYSVGTQYNAKFKRSNLIFGIENNGAWLTDKKLGYPDFENATIVNDSIINIPHTDNVVVADQRTNTSGLFSQYEFNLDKLKISAGARFDLYKIIDSQNSELNTSGKVLSPRLTLKYDIKKYLQARLSYSQGYRAPQIFDEDLHIEASGSRKIIHKNSPDLKQERSHSYMASLDFNKQIDDVYVGFLLEGFYTKLNNPFASKYDGPDADDIVIYTRYNAEASAKIKGVNIELNVVPSHKLSFKAGFTIQSSQYEAPQEFNEKRFLRTPEDYGYFTLDWEVTEKLDISSTGNYTGKMLVPYFGQQIPNPDEGELRDSKRFFDVGMKARYNIDIKGGTLQLYGGIKNIFNSYQDDFDTGIDRDPGYIYGPSEPRTTYVGLKFGNLLK